MYLGFQDERLTGDTLTLTGKGFLVEIRWCVHALDRWKLNNRLYMETFELIDIQLYVRLILK